MAVDDARLQGIVERLAAFESRGATIRDGLGIYLGDGLPHTAGCELRSGELLCALRELQARRLEQVGIAKPAAE